MLYYISNYELLVEDRQLGVPKLLKRILRSPAASGSGFDARVSQAGSGRSVALELFHGAIPTVFAGNIAKSTQVVVKALG